MKSNQPLWIKLRILLWQVWVICRVKCNLQYQWKVVFMVSGDAEETTDQLMNQKTTTMTQKPIPQTVSKKKKKEINTKSKVEMTLHRTRKSSMEILLHDRTNNKKTWCQCGQSGVIILNKQLPTKQRIFLRCTSLKMYKKFCWK